jgi:lipopolysaccharide export system protein LptA
VSIIHSDNSKAKEDIEISDDSEIYNISYKKFDILNNVYLIEAEKGIIKNKNPNVVIMTNVKASITYLNNDKILISSNKAILDKKNFETNFFDEVKLTYQDHELNSDSLEFLFNKNVAIFKDNVRYQNLNTKMFSNKITINLLTRDIEISSKNKLDKVKVQKTN